MDPADDPDLSSVGAFLEAHAEFQRVLGRHLEAECGMSLQWFDVLLRLRRSPAARMRMSDLAARTTLTPSGLTRAVDRLAHAGLVARQTCTDDRRVAYAVLTEAGRARIDAAVGVHLAHVRALVAGAVGERDLAELGRISRDLRDSLRAGATAAPCCPAAGSPSPAGC